MTKKELKSLSIASEVSETPTPPLPALLSLFRTMHTIRAFEERVADLLEAKEIHCPCHLYVGQEAIAAGVCEALEKTDTVWGTHRSHGHYLAKGGDLKAMMAELYGKATGCSRGRGGSMHLVAPDVGILGTVPLVAATIPLAVGAGLTAKLKGNRGVSVTFFGDGAMDEGHVHESINLAAIYRLPVIFACENNFYSSHMQLSERRLKDNLHQIGEWYGIPGFAVDGNDVIAVYRATKEAVERARNEQGPTFLEFRTYRWRGHVGPSWDMDVGVKRKDELHEWLPKDPIKRLKGLLNAGGVSHEVLSRLEKEISSEIDEAVLFARESPFPSASDLQTGLFAERNERS